MFINDQKLPFMIKHSPYIGGGGPVPWGTPPPPKKEFFFFSNTTVKHSNVHTFARAWVEFRVLSFARNIFIALMNNSKNEMEMVEL